MLEKLKSKLAEKSKNLSQGIIDIVKAPDEVRESRLSICRSCDNLHAKSELCKLCGCYVPAKTWLPSSSCPINKWTKFNA